MYLIRDLDDPNEYSQYADGGACGWSSRDRAKRFSLADGMLRVLQLVGEFRINLVLEPDQD